MTFSERIHGARLSDEDIYEVRRAIIFAAGWLRRYGPPPQGSGLFWANALTHLDDALRIMGEKTTDQHKEKPNG